MTNDQLRQVRTLLETAQSTLTAAQNVLRELGSDADQGPVEPRPNLDAKARDIGREDVYDNERVIEGVFDGFQMIGPDGKKYTVPSNYASKSKLVEGDVMKLTVAADGTFMYKQIRPIDRDRLIGVLTKDEETGEYRVLANGQHYNVLLASVTYFKGVPGDESVILVPQGGQSEWAAVENILKALPQAETIEPSSELPAPEEKKPPELLEAGKPTESVEELEDIDEL